MTEQEWLSATDPEQLLQLVRAALGPRRERLIAVAICTQLRWLLTDPVSVSALETVEAFADGLVSHSRLRRAADLAAGVYDADVATTAHGQAERYAAAAVAHAAGRGWPSLWSLRTATVAVRHCEIGDALVRRFASVLRDIVPYPHRSVAVEPKWLTSTVVALADGIYAEKAFDRMPVLADALQDAGCDDESVLRHCREAGEHWRGCWVVDSLLGKV